MNIWGTDERAVGNTHPSSPHAHPESPNIHLLDPTIHPLLSGVAGVLPHQHINLCYVTGRLHPGEFIHITTGAGVYWMGDIPGSSFSSKRRRATESLAQLAASASSARVSECKCRERERERGFSFSSNATHRIASKIEAARARSREEPGPLPPPRHHLPLRCVVSRPHLAP